MAEVLGWRIGPGLPRPCRGYNGTGAIGDGTTVTRPTPVLPIGLPQLKAVASGDQDLMIGADAANNVWVWGRGSLAPQLKGTVGPVAKVSAGAGHVSVLTTTGQMWSFGGNGSGQIGNGTTTNTTALVQVSTSTGMTSVASMGAGYNIAGAIDSANNLWMWGSNTTGEFGDGTTTSSNLPRKITKPVGMGTLVDIELGVTNTLALNSAGEVWAWGRDDVGQRGNGPGVTPTPTPPTKVVFPVGVVIREINAGTFSSVAVDTQNRLWRWGLNLDVPLLETRISDVKHADEGYTQTFASTINGTLYSWGQQYTGQLGNGALTGVYPTPLLVKPAPGQPTAFLQDVDDFAAGGNASLAILKDIALHESVSSKMIRGPSCSYSIRSSVTPCGLVLSAQDPVSTSTGAFQESMNDLSLPGKGQGFMFTRAYDSQVSLPGPLGPGWSHGYDQSVSVNSTTGVGSWFADGGQTDLCPRLGCWLVLRRLPVAGGS
jgi:hypothetical protein